MKTKIVLAILLIISIMEINAQTLVKRNELSNVNIGKREISSVKIVEIEFQAGQKAPLHKHPCPIVGQIVSGTCLVQIEGENPQVLKSGDTFYEPAETPLIHFDNHSETAPMKFVAYYLTNGEKDLIEILETKEE
ncbi:cupin domain-containing protein [Yeosuana marina]|uniref:cupin domain-containing protein n=1 Tax=Yeosuana marina TaxID=1565536 RepID=UPI0030EBB6A1|tara:strand:+ start:1126 stop:1530 length:405 start_codon:yes stop_codon:yes gene_type:complete